MRSLNARQRQRTDTAARWTAANPLLLRGEIGYESDTGRFKFGDGTVRWSSLPYRGGVATVNGAAPDGSGNVQIAAGGGNAFDLTVRTQQEFEAMIASPSWLNAQSVLLCGVLHLPGTGGTGITVPEGVLILEGAPGAELCADDDVGFVLQYAQPPETNTGRRVANLTVRCLGVGGGFAHMQHLTNCRALECTTGFTGCEGLVGCYAEVKNAGFSACLSLTDCSVFIERGSICSGFSNCRRVTNCVATINRGTYSRGFDTCHFLCNCVANVTGTSLSVCYSDCTHCSCCARGTMSANGQTWSGPVTTRCSATCDA